MELLDLFDLWYISFFPLIYSVSQQATKTPIYSILLSMINAKHSGFVSDVLTAIQQSLINAIREGDCVGSILRVGFVLIA